MLYAIHPYLNPKLISVNLDFLCFSEHTAIRLDAFLLQTAFAATAGLSLSPFSKAMDEFLLIFGMFLVTFGIRYSMFALSGRIHLSQSLLNALRYVPPVVLTVIVVPAVFMPSGETLELGLTNARLVGAIAAFTTGWFTRNLLLTILVGMATFLFLSWELSH
jgi:branched-subunit amino acid transport protein